MKYWTNIKTGASIEFNEENGDYNGSVFSCITHQQVKFNGNNNKDMSFGQMCYIEDIVLYGFGTKNMAQFDEIIGTLVRGL